MADIKIERQPKENRLQDLGVSDWPIWTKEASEFPWSYDEAETCYFLKGDVVVTPMGTKHQFTALTDNVCMLWMYGELKGRKRIGHVHDE